MESQELRDSLRFEHFAKQNSTIELRKTKAKHLRTPGISCKIEHLKYLKELKNFQKNKQETIIFKKKFGEENVKKF